MQAVTPCFTRIAAAVWLIAIGANASVAGQYEGFTEPFRTVNVASGETGEVTELLVREGEKVTRGQVIAKLDDEVLRALLAVAEQDMNARGKIEAAQAELGLQQARLAKIEQLRVSGHARQEEVARARGEVAVAQAQLLSAKEESLLKQLQYEKIKVQLARRTIRAPVDGVVTVIHKEAGEFVAPIDPLMVTIVQLDPLLAVFSLPAEQAMQVTLGQPVKVQVAGHTKPIGGQIERIATVNDAESGTVRIHVRVANPGRALRSGRRCTLQFSQKREIAKPSAKPESPANPSYVLQPAFKQ